MGIVKLPVRNPERWWKNTRWLVWPAALVMLIAAMAAAGVGDLKSGWTVSGLPVLGFLALCVLPFGLAGAVYWLALRQEKVDRQHSVWESR